MTSHETGAVTLPKESRSRACGEPFGKETWPVKTKELELLAQLWTDEGARQKVALVVRGKGRSNDDAIAACWREAIRRIRAMYPGRTGIHWKARSVFFRNVED
jgi:hypothetical protein